MQVVYDSASLPFRISSYVCWRFSGVLDGEPATPDAPSGIHGALPGLLTNGWSRGSNVRVFVPFLLIGESP
jgi:hypothetical protein